MNEKVSPDGTYPKTDRNRVKRAHERGSYDHASVHAILDSTPLCHISWVRDGQPFCTPTIHWRDGNRLYWHGSSASRMIRTQGHGVPVCLTVTHLDGLVMAKTGFNHSANYRSVMCYGNARAVEDHAEKVAALTAMIERYFPGRNKALRPLSEQDIKATGVIAMEIEEASAKVRAKGVVVDPEDAHWQAWAGVIPVKTVLGAMEPAAENNAEPVMTGIDKYMEGQLLDQVMGEMAALYGA